MILTFERHTAELTEAEMALLNPLLRGFKAHTAESPIKEADIVCSMSKYCSDNNIQVRFTGARLRKFVNYIRVNSIIPLIATSNGYFCATSRKEIENQINSLRQRAQSIISCAEGMEKFLHTTE